MELKLWGECGIFAFLSALILIMALCLDSFVASIALGADGVIIPPGSAAIIGGVSSAVLVASMVGGWVLAPFLPQGLSNWISFLVLFILGVMRLFDGTMKAILSRLGGSADICFRVLSFQFLLTVYADGSKADCDHSKTLSHAEAAALSLALSLDSLAAGVGASLGGGVPILFSGVMAFLVCSLMVLLGGRLGRLTRGCRSAMSVLAGGALMALGFVKLF